MSRVAVIRIELAPGVELSREKDRLQVEKAGQRLIVSLPSPLEEAVLNLLESGGRSEKVLLKAADKASPAQSTARFHRLLRRLSDNGLMCRRLERDGRPLASFIPTQADVDPQPARLKAGCAVRLCRWSFARRGRQGLTWSTPLQAVEVVIHDRRASGWMSDMARPTGWVLPAKSYKRSTARSLFASLMAGCGLAEVIEGEADHDSPHLSRKSHGVNGLGEGTWEFHDLLFHLRSRPAAGALTPPPGDRCEEGPGPPQEWELTAGERPCGLERVFAQRRSRRSPGPDPPSLGDLGHLLALCCRDQKRDVDGNGSEIVFRSYPSAGARHPLRFHLVVRACRGLPPGLFRYSSRTHRLRRIRPWTPQIERLLEDAAAAAGISQAPHLLIVMTARLSRTSEKYSSIAYASVLKEVGAAMQTLSLAASALGLAGCPLAFGDSLLFARASGLDWTREPAVGEFMFSGSPESVGERA